MVKKSHCSRTGITFPVQITWMASKRYRSTPSATKTQRALCAATNQDRCTQVKGKTYSTDVCVFTHGVIKFHFPGPILEQCNLAQILIGISTSVHKAWSPTLHTTLPYKELKIACRCRQELLNISSVIKRTSAATASERLNSSMHSVSIQLNTTSKASSFVVVCNLRSIEESAMW